MIKKIYLGLIVALLMSFTSCVSVPTSKNRNLTLSGITVNEQDFGGCERWYAIDKYNYDDLIEKIRLQVGYFKNNNIGFVLFENGTVGEEAVFYRHGLDLRWDWGPFEKNGNKNFRYSFVIEPDGTGLYYDFSMSTDGTAKPRGIYKTKKF